MKHELPNIVFEVTTQCNLDCRYCYNIWKMPGAEDPGLNSYRQARKTLKRLFRMADVQHLTFTGGEPMMAERIGELILYARLKKKGVTLITNGSLLDEEHCLTLMELGVGLFEIPVHSAQAGVHDAMTRVAGSWENAVNSIRILRSMGAAIVPVVVITRINAPYIRETLKFINELGYKRIMMNRYNIGGEGLKENHDVLPTHPELRAVFKAANETAAQLRLDLSSNVCTPFCLLDPGDYPDIAFGSCSADPKKLPLTLDIEGNLRLCNHSPVVAGNIFKDSFDAIFASDHFSGWLKTVPHFCKDCGQYNKCLGGCRSAARQMGRSSDEVDPVMTLVP